MREFLQDRLFLFDLWMCQRLEVKIQDMLLIFDRLLYGFGHVFGRGVLRVFLLFG